MKKDKSEMKNVNGDKKYRNRKAKLKQQLAARIQKYEDEDAVKLLKMEPAFLKVKTF